MNKSFPIPIQQKALRLKIIKLNWINKKSVVKWKSVKVFHVDNVYCNNKKIISLVPKAH